MDVVGTAAAIIQLAGVGLALAKTLYSLYDESAAGNEQVKELSSYVHVTATVLEEIGKVFEEEGKAAKPLISKNAITTATGIVTRCSTTFNTLQEMANNAQKTTMGLLMLPLKAPRLKLLQTKLEQSKLDLQLMMQIILYARLKNDPRAFRSGKESDQRKVVENIIEERNAAHTSYLHEAQANRRTENALVGNATALQAPEGSKHDSGESPTSQAPEDSDHDFGESSASQAEAVRSLEGPTGDERVQPIQHEGSHPSRDHDPGSPGGGQVSYWVALSVVCCPCFSAGIQRKTSQLPGHELTTYPQVPGEFFRTQRLSEDRKGYASPAPLPRSRPFGSSFRLSTSEVDRLLYEWTTIYDDFLAAYKQSAGNSSTHSFSTQA